MKDRLSIWIILALFGLGTHEIIDEMIRPQFGKGESVISFILGILPNYLAAGFIFPFAVLTIRDTYTTNGQKKNIINLNTWFWIGLVGSQLGLILWELIQLDSKNLVYDPFDIVATLIGGITAIGIFEMSKAKYIQQIENGAMDNEA